MSHDFDALSYAARTLVSKTARHELWHAALSLPEWYFVGTGEGEDVAPLVGVSEGRPHLLAFTDEDRAHEFAAARAARKGCDPGVLLGMTPSEAVEYVVQLREQVDGVLLNSGEHGFAAQPMELKDMHDRHGA
ncbi:MAG: hypothetical protein ACOYN0_17320 [Phycisphaerales bacterium]